MKSSRIRLFGAGFGLKSSRILPFRGDSGSEPFWIPLDPLPVLLPVQLLALGAAPPISSSILGPSQEFFHILDQILSDLNLPPFSKSAFFGAWIFGIHPQPCSPSPPAVCSSLSLPLFGGKSRIFGFSSPLWHFTGLPPRSSGAPRVGVIYFYF